MRTSSSGASCSAMVRHLHKHAVSISNVELLRSCSGKHILSDEITLGPKKKERCAMSSGGGFMVFWESATSSYSRCSNVTRGGLRALSSSLDQTGSTDGAFAPRAASVTAFMNSASPGASAMVWLNRTAKMNPPHNNRHLNQEQWRVKNTPITLNVEEELLHAWERWL
ncbi:hypothetical protein DsansV1_C29g0210101 [Dioscorea sansibarensis]